MKDPLQEAVPFLLQWFRDNARILPWREEPTPYYIWVSEIMLQQTRVEAVKDYFARFVEALPSISALAEAPEETILKLWEGLGYYNRVRNMQKAAQKIQTEYQGEMPRTYEELKKLPGIGSYTAGAIASNAFGEVVPSVDGNVLRVTMRLGGWYDDISKDVTKKKVEKMWGNAMSKEHPGEFNQSLMELGAVICLPNGAPLCDQCPVQHLCVAYREELELTLPRKGEKKERRKEEKTLLIVQKGQKTALKKRPSKGLLAGLYEIPSLEGKKTKEEVETWMKERGYQPASISKGKKAKHIFSHVEWEMESYVISLPKDAPLGKDKETQDWIFATPKEIQQVYPLPSAFQAYREKLESGIRDYSDKT